MAKHYVIAAGLVLMASAKAVSWILNVQTEKERKKQLEEIAHSDEIRAQFNAAIQRQQEGYVSLLRQRGNEQGKFLLDAISARHIAVEALPEELDRLEKMIGQEVADQTSSPYRKSALRREYARIEDAIVRIREYKKYLHNEEERIRSFLENEEFESLLKLNAAETLLPISWLYAGKLVLVSMGELGQHLPPFNHRISFGKDDAAQRALALRYGEDIPVLIRSAHKHHDGLFYGCVARGAAYYLFNVNYLGRSASINLAG